MKENRKKNASGAAGRRGKSSVLLLIAAVLILAVGVCVLLYPTVSNYLAELRQLRVIEEYEEVVESGEVDYSEEWALAEEYNDSLTGDVVQDPFVAGSGYTIPDNYDEVLNISGDGVMGYLSIPEIDVYLPIYHGTSDEVLEKGVGHVDYSSLPIGGERSHCILSAHRGLPNAKLFTDLDQLEIGDRFYITVLDETLAYEVDQISVVDPDDFSELQFEKDQDYVTLITCTPYGVNTQRLLVRGHRVEYTEDEELETSASRKSNLLLKGTLAGILAAAVVILVVWLVVREVRKMKGKGNSGTEQNASQEKSSPGTEESGAGPPGGSTDPPEDGGEGPEG